MVSYAVNEKTGADGVAGNRTGNFALSINTNGKHHHLVEIRFNGRSRASWEYCSGIPPIPCPVGQAILNMFRRPPRGPEYREPVAN